MSVTSGARRAPDVPASSEYRPGYEQVAAEILRHIALHGLRPGDRVLTEAKFATQLGVSRSQVREAVKMLSALGRVTVRKGVGILVAEPTAGVLQEAFSSFLPVDLEDVFSLFELRKLLEGESARLAASLATPLELRRITAAAEQCEAAARSDDFSAFRQADIEFHCSIATASHNSFFISLVKMVTHLRRQIIDLGLQGDRSGSLLSAASQHLGVLRAIANGDSDGAANSMLEHVNITLKQYQDGIRDRLFKPR
jgi:GntR family transcriptional repressor for pyruvate dehydrogenase complex